jgi:hypothetical protein
VGGSSFAQTNAPAPKPAAAPNPSLVNGWLRDKWPEASKWDLGGQVRLRYEVKENAGVLGATDFVRALPNDNDWLMVRAKVHLGYTPCAWISAYVEGRDSTDHGDVRSPSPDRDRFDLHQAYVTLGSAKEFPLTAKLGRQELSYGDERYLGAADWANTPRAFDAAKLRYQRDNWWVDALAGRVVIPYDRHFNVANDYDWLFGLYASARNVVPKHETDLFFLARTVAPRSPTAITPGLGGPGARDIYMPGFRLKSLPGAAGNWDYSFEVAGQLGSMNQAGVRRKLSAFGLGLNGGYTFKETWGSPRVALGYDYGTGDDNAADGEVNTFQNMFGTNHKYYGLMDLFGGWNMHIPRANVALKPVKNLTVSSELLFFFLANNRDALYTEAGAGRAANGYGINTQYGHFAGTELDLVANYAIRPWANVQLGYGHFFVGDYIRGSVGAVPANGGTVDADWCYLQATLNF